MAGRKAKCLKCAQVIVIPNPERDRWPPGMEPPGAKYSSAPAAAPQASPPKKAQPASPPAARPAAVKPTAPQQGAGSPPRAQPVAKTVSPAQPIVAAPVINVQPQAASAIPVAKAVPVVPVAAPGIPSLGETMSDDIDDLLAFETSAPALTRVRPPTDNPYQSPQAAAVDQRETPTGKVVRYGETLDATWRIYKANFGTCLAGSVLASVGVGVILGLIELGTQGFVELVKQNQWQSNTLAITFVCTLLFAIFATILFFSMGLIEFLLQIARGREADFSRLVGTADLLFPSLGMFVMVLLLVLVGSLFLIVPGILVAFLFALAPFAMVDRQEGPVAALATSARLVSANFLTTALLILTVMPACGAISTLTCGLGQLATGPFQMLMMIVIYMRASGKRLAID